MNGTIFRKKQIEHKRGYANKHNNYTLLVANVSAECLGDCGIIF
jgi:hypothetical protein